MLLFFIHGSLKILINLEAEALTKSYLSILMVDTLEHQRARGARNKLNQSRKGTQVCQAFYTHRSLLRLSSIVAQHPPTEQNKRKGDARGKRKLFPTQGRPPSG